MFSVNQVHWREGKRKTPQNTELDCFFIGISFLVTWAKHKENVAVVLGPPWSTLPCSVLVFTITGSVHLLGLWRAVERSCEDTGWLTYPHCIQIKVFVRLQHTNRARTQPSPLNSWILLCFCMVCVLCSLKLKSAFGFAFNFSLT